MATFTDHPGGDIFASGADVLVCPVNCVGAMGKGLALAFKWKWPDVAANYGILCRDGRMALGECALTFGADGQAVLLFPTKGHWRERSTLEAIAAGLADYARFVGQRYPGFVPTSIAIPALGCGLGGLDWRDVRPLIVEALRDLPLRVMLYPPHEVA